MSLISGLGIMPVVQNTQASAADAAVQDNQAQPAVAQPSESQDSASAQSDSGGQSQGQAFAQTNPGQTRFNDRMLSKADSESVVKAEFAAEQAEQDISAAETQVRDAEFTSQTDDKIAALVEDLKIVQPAAKPDLTAIEQTTDSPTTASDERATNATAAPV
ncbi:MAG: hypothetical protein AB8B71_02405 [Paracoccaceae bacterium]